MSWWEIPVPTHLRRFGTPPQAADSVVKHSASQDSIQQASGDNSQNIPVLADTLASKPLELHIATNLTEVLGNHQADVFLSDAQKEELRSMLVEHQEAFAHPDRKPTRTNLVKFHLRTA